MNLGDIAPGAILDCKFTTINGATGLPATLGGTPAVSVYKDNSTTQSTAGVTLTVDFDAVTGLNHLRIDTSADGTFYAAGSNFQAVITTGTVGGNSVVGMVLRDFSVNKRPLQALASGVINEAAFNADSAKYQAKVHLLDDNTGTNDRYIVTWFKNGEPIVAGITSPTIQVIKASDGTDLIASTAMTQIATTGLYKKDEATNRVVNGAAYIAKVQAIIDSATRSWYQPVGRDS